MKYFTLLFLMATLCTNTRGQKILYNNEPVDTIKISSTVGVYMFDDEGTSRGRNEVLTIAFNNTLNKYQVLYYQIEKSIYRFHPIPKHDSFEKDTRQVKSYSNSELTQQTLSRLIKSLEQNKKLNYSLPDKEFKNYVNYRTVRRIAKRHNGDWHFKRKYMIKEERDSIIKGCQSLDTFNIYLSEISDTSSFGMTLVTDVHSGLEIELTYNTFDKVLFETQYPDIWGIPWYYDTHTSPWQYKYILNSDINHYFLKLVPRTFLNKEHLEIKQLIDLYIKWYLQRKDIILFP